MSGKINLLNDTDLEENKAVPADIVTARANAKQLLRDNNITYTLM